uniref:Ig-like V-type domain-containing protein FAM187A n=2 Tax=Ciona intestinalis TaxID=7719 RepID=F6RE92_CIOIN
MHRLAVYHLNVVDVLHMQTIYLDADEQPHDNGRYGIDWITWHWTAWQECDRCDVAGERRRYGFCYTSETSLDDVIGRRLPCRSRLLPEVKRQRLMRFHDYVAIASCTSRCKKKPDHYYVDANTGKLPVVPHQVTRQLIQQTTGSSVNLSCTDASPNSAVGWQFINGSMGNVVHLTKYAVNRKQLLHIATSIRQDDSLYIESISNTNKGYYVCYADQQLVASYRLQVTSGLFDLNMFLDSLIYLVLFIVILVFVMTAIAVIRSGLFRDTKY